MSLEQKDKNMKKFREGSVRMIVTNLEEKDVIIPGIELVINYDFPVSCEDYVKRAGKRGRFGRRGVAISFIISSDSKLLCEIEKIYSTIITELPLDPNFIFESQQGF